MPTASTERRRVVRYIVTLSCFLLLVGICWPAFAQDDSAADDEATVVKEGDSLTRFAASVRLGSFAFGGPEKAVLLRRATGAAVRAVRSGLVLFDVTIKGGDSRLYVKFGSDGMPRLRWQTRF